MLPSPIRSSQNATEYVENPALEISDGKVAFQSNDLNENIPKHYVKNYELGRRPVAHPGGPMGPGPSPP